MPSAFSRTLRSLDDREPRARRALGALAALAAWGTWMVVARVDVHASSVSARLEAADPPSRVAASEAGRVTELHLDLGRRVAAGEVLVQLDTSVEDKLLAEAQAHAAGLEPKLAALRARLAAARAVRAARSRLNGVGAERAEAERDQAEAARAREEQLAEIAGTLRDNQLLSGADKVRADAEVERRRLELRGANVEVARQSAASRYEDDQEAARIAELTASLADLESERQASLASAETASAQIARRTVRAAASGRLGTVSALQVGDVLAAGDVIATVVSESEVRVVAELRPADALGRVVPGQTARVRLDGFSWVEYGAIEARVAEVASEGRDGTVRVELVAIADPARRLPLQHGIPAAVDVRVEQTSPLTLLLRGVGAAAAPASAPSSTPAPALPARDPAATAARSAQ
jgi:membrane fusion protein (multidrug efflux system)